MRKLLLALLILALASPAWAQATFIWTAAVSADATVAGNWTDENGDPVLVPPGNGDTIAAISSTSPTTPLVSGALNFDIRNPAVQNLDLAKFLVGAATASGINIENGAYCIWSTTEPITEYVNIQAGRLDFTASGTTVVTKSIFVIAGGTLGVTHASGNLDVNGAITGTGNENEDNGTINLVGAITGAVNLSSLQAGYVWTGAGTVTVDLQGVTLDLGTTADNNIGVVVNSAGAVTMGNSFRCGAFALTAANALVAGGYTITVGGNATWATSNVVITGDLNLRFAANGTWRCDNVQMPNLVTIDSGVTVTMGSYCYARAINNAGTLYKGALGYTLEFRVQADDFFVNTGTVSLAVLILEFGSKGTSGAAVTRTVNGNLNTGTVTSVQVYMSAGASNTSRTLSILGNWNIGAVPLNIYGGGGNERTMALCVSGALQCGAVTLGKVSNTATPGVIQGCGTITCSTLARAASNTGTGHKVLLGVGTVHAGGNWTLAGITTAFGSARLYTTGAITIDGATATALTASGPILTGYRGPLTLSNMTATTGGVIYARRWVDGGSNGTVVKTLAPPFILGIR